MKNWQNKYPPYEGTEPYLYLAFGDGDGKKVWPVMKVLLQRGCRVWYCTGRAGNSGELLRRQERAAGAAWTVLYLTDALTSDKESKSRIMVNQASQKTILCLNPDSKNRYLAMDLRESTPGIPLYRYKTDAELDDALIHAEGYTQEIIGPPVSIQDSRLGKLTRVFFLLAVVLAGFCLYYLSHAPAPEDTVSFSDPVIREAARTAAGGGVLNEESLESIQTLHLTELPDSWDDLRLLPGLVTIEITQEAAAEAGQLPVDTYRIVLYGGGV